MAENETVSAIDADTKSMLKDDVKKGKARKFILLCKGASIKTLVVFKKGPYGPRLMEAKKEGFRGEAYCGVISGKGANVDLQLPGNDAVSKAMNAEGNVYDSVPCKDGKLREFFAEETELKLKPTITIVTNANQVFSVSETDVESETDEQEVEDETEEEAAPSVDDEAALSDDTAKQELVEEMKKLLPTVQQAIQAAPNRKAEILAPTAEFNVHIKKDELDSARQVLTSYVPFLKEILAGSPVDEGAAWREAVARVESRYLAVLSGQPANATALRAVWEYAGEQAAAAKYPAAMVGLARLEKLLDEAEKQGAAKQTDVIPQGIVADKVKRLEALRTNWLEVRVRSVEGLSELLSVLEVSDDQELLEIGGRVDTLATSIPAKIEASLSALGAAVQTGEAAKIKSQKLEVQGGLKECAEYLKQNQHPIDCCENNPFGIAVSVRQPLAQSLKEISASVQTL